MIRKIISFFGLFFGIALQGCHNASFVGDLAVRNLSVISVHDVAFSHTLKTYLDTIQGQKTDLNTIFVGSNIEKIFSTDLSRYTDASAANSVRVLQNLILLSLYQKIFQHYIVTSETFLNDLLIAKKYWMYEDFHMKQPFFGKNIVYNFYSSEYQNKITAKLTALDGIENNIAGILGFCLYGLSTIQKIKHEDAIVEHMMRIIDQFFKLFNTSELNNEEKRDPVVLYNQALWMYDTIQRDMNSAQLGMKQNDKPSFLVDHWFGISCAAIAAITVGALYIKHEQTVKSVYEQGKIAAPNFLQEYVIHPVVGLKEVVWDQKTKKLQHVEHFPDIPQFADVPQFSNIPQSADLPEYDGYSTLLVNPILNPLVREINITKKDLIKTANGWKDDTVKTVNEWKSEIIKTANEWKEASEQTLNTKIDEANDTIIKNNQINMYLATIGPVLFGTYALCSSSYKAYEHYIRNKNWYLPMRYIIRSIDQLVNQIARSCTEHNFVDDGKLYMLVQHFKSYIGCLNNEELFLMYNDIDELLSFDLNYAQKKGVIDRMYKTYEFLK